MINQRLDNIAHYMCLFMALAMFVGAGIISTARPPTSLPACAAVAGLGTPGPAN